MTAVPPRSNCRSAGSRSRRCIAARQQRGVVCACDMFGLSNRRGKRAAGPIAATAAAAPMPAQQEAQPPPPHAQSSDAQSPHAQSPHANLLQRWMSLAAMQQRVIETLAAEITRTSDFVETE